MDRSIYSIRRNRRRTAIAKIVLLLIIGCVIFTPKLDIQDVPQIAFVTASAN